MKEGKYILQGTIMLLLLFFGFLIFKSILKSKPEIAPDISALQADPVFINYLKQAEKGKALFIENCGICHKKKHQEHLLSDITERIQDRTLLRAWIRNPQAVLASGNKYFTDLYNIWNRAPMSGSPHLSDEEIDAILLYINSADY